MRGMYTYYFKTANATKWTEATRESVLSFLARTVKLGSPKANRTLQTMENQAPCDKHWPAPYGNGTLFLRIDS